MTGGEQRAEKLAQRMTAEVAADGTRYLVLDGVALGRLWRDAESGRWRCEWRAGWRETPAQLERDDAEYAEVWAIDEVATLLAMEERARESG